MICVYVVICMRKGFRKEAVCAFEVGCTETPMWGGAKASASQGLKHQVAPVACEVVERCHSAPEHAGGWHLYRKGGARRVLNCFFKQNDSK